MTIRIGILPERPDRAAPIFECDYCDKRITGSANALWKIARGKGTLVDGMIFHTHKRCNQAFEAKNSSEEYSWAWEELSVFVVFLLRNLGVPYAKAREMAKAFEGM
jgi:hypothetical protein